MREANNIQERISPELRLMLDGVRGDSAGVQRLLTLPVNWELFLCLTIYHQVYPLVYKMFSQFESLAVPDNVILFLRALCRENSFQALNMTGETIRMVNRLESHGIRVIVLKGTPLALYLYGDITIRPSIDVDLLVAPEMVKLATKILEDEGYRETQPELDLTPRQYQIYLRSHAHAHHVAFWHDERKALLEMHWDMGHFGQVVLPMPTDAGVKRILVEGSSLPVLADEERILYLILHGASHAWYSLRWLVDIEKFMRRELDWEKVESLARSLGMQAIFHQGLILAHRLLDAPLPPGYQSTVLTDHHAERLSEMAIDLCLSFFDNRLNNHDGDYEDYRLYIYNYQMRVGWRNKVNYILSLWRPTASDIRLISLPDPLYPLYYVIRPFTFFIELFTNRQKVEVN